MAGYIGQAPANKFLTLDKQTFTTSATDTYSLDKTVSSANEIELFLNNVRQEPIEAYTVSGNTLTLASAITSSDTMYCIYQGKAIGSISPATNSVSNDMLVNSSVTVNGTSISLGGSETITAGKIGQIISSSYSTQLNVSSDGDTDTGLTASITPSSTSSKILVLAYVTAGKNGSTWITLRLKRNTGTNLILYAQSAGFTDNSNYNWLGTQTVMHLDSPNTTSTTSYKVTIARNNSQGTVTAQHDGGVSTMILMEVLA